MSNSITIEEAVARMVNFENIPDGISLIDSLDLCVRIAEDDLDEAKANKLPSKQIDLFKYRVKACNARFELAGYLKLLIEWELDTSLDNSCLKLSPDSSSTTRLEVDSMAEWAGDKFEIGRFGYEELKEEHKELKNELQGELPKKAAENEACRIADEGLSGDLAKQLYNLSAFLLEEYVKIKLEKDKDYGSVDEPNKSKLAEELAQAASTSKGERRGYGKETLKTRIENALAMKELFVKD